MKTDNILVNAFSGAIANCTGVTVSNLIDQAKVRLKIQRVSATKTPQRVDFRNPFDCIWKVAKREGLRKAHRGLSAAYLQQFIMNGTRYGTCESINILLDHQAHISKNIFVNLFIGFTSGFVGVTAAWPFQMMKTMLHNDLPLQGKGGYHYNGFVDAFRKVYRTERMGGVMRDSKISRLAVAWALGVQANTYNMTLNSLARVGQSRDSVSAHFCSAFIAGLVVSVFCKPTNSLATKATALIRERRASQMEMKSHKIFGDLIARTKAEGLKGLYKGYTGYALLQVTHTVISYVALEFYRDRMKNYIMNNSTN